MRNFGSQRSEDGLRPQPGADSERDTPVGEDHIDKGFGDKYAVLEDNMLNAKPEEAH